MSTILDTQSFHFGIGDIERLGRVIAPSEQMPQNQFALVPQAYDNPSYQRIFGRMIEMRLEGMRSRSRETIAVREQRAVTSLSRLVDFAYRHVPFYRKLYEEAGFKPGEIRSLSDFRSLPTISKLDLIETEPAAFLGPGSNKTSYLSRTSGSSGRPLDYHYGPAKCFFEMANYLWMGESAKGAPLDPDRWIYNIHNARWWLSSLCGKYRTYTVADMPPLGSFEKHVRLLRPEILVTLPSHLTSLCVAKQALLDAGVRAITTNSEQSSISERRAAEEYLGIPVRDEYSSTELGTIAFENADGRYRLLEDSVYIEILNPDALGVGEVVGTRLTNRVMPTIRYRQGDYATLDQEAADGRGYRNLTQIHGKINSSFKRESGIIPSGSLMSAIDEYIVDRASGIIDIQMIQRSYFDIDIHLVAPGGPNWTSIDALKANIDRIFGYDVNYRVDVVGAIPNKTSFKRKTLICEVE